MSRDLVLATLALVLCGAGTSLSGWLSGWLPAGSAGPDDARVSGRALERRRWRGLWLPMLPAALALAMLAGWALQEPRQTDELLRPIVVVLVVPFGVVWLRSAIRAVLALRRPSAAPLVATFGLLRPTIVVDDGVRRALDPAALAAALAHERAHARKRDPLRIWLAQLATDAQWPSPAAGRRLDHWLGALEIARDEDARRAGVRGADLAAAVVAVAGMAAHARRGIAVAQLTGAEASLASRVRRLLVPVPEDGGAEARGAAARSRSPSLSMSATLSAFGLVGLVAALAVAMLVGLELGDSLLRALPFITT